MRSSMELDHGEHSFPPGSIVLRFFLTFPQIIDKTDYVAADMWVFWQIPSYFFVGLSEILASISGVELAYSHAPVSMQGIVMGLFYLSTGKFAFGKWQSEISAEK